VSKENSEIWKEWGESQGGWGGIVQGRKMMVRCAAGASVSYLQLGDRAKEQLGSGRR